MKKVIYIIAFVMCITSTLSPLFAIAIAANIAFPFIGRWQPSEDSVVLDDYGLQTIYNMRRDGKSLVGIKGHTLVGTHDTTYPDIQQVVGYYNHDTLPSPKSYFLVNSRPAANTHIFKGYTSTVPGGTMTNVFNSGVEGANGHIGIGPRGSIIWSGDSTKLFNPTMYPIKVFLSATNIGNGLTNIEDVSDKNNCTSSTDDDCTYTYNSTTSYLIMGFPAPIESLYVDVATANTATSTLTAYHGTSTLTIASDGTTVSGKSMAQDGVITFTSPTTETKPFLVEGYSLYWYALRLSSSSDFDITSITGSTASSGTELRDIWDGIYTPIAYMGVCNDGVDCDDLRDETIMVQSDNQSTYAAIDHSAFIVGSTIPLQGLLIKMVSGKENNFTSASGAVQCHLAYDDSFHTVSAPTGPAVDDAPLNRSGITSWRTTPGSGSYGDESPFSLNGGETLYYYKFQDTTGTLSANTQIYYIAGIPVQNKISTYAFSALFTNRLFLFNTTDEPYKNQALYSAYNTYYVFNGFDSGSVYFGDNTPVVGAVGIYNVFQSTGYEQLIVTKANSTYRLIGNTPETFEVQQLSSTIGTTAPNSMAVCDMVSAERDDSGRYDRHVALWVSSAGVVMCDGAKIELISYDIRKYWDKNNATDYISASDQAKAVGWYDPTLEVYKLIIGGHEFEYSLRYREWTLINRGSDALVAGCMMEDAKGVKYAYGVDAAANVYRLEYGATFNGDTIPKYLQTGDLFLDTEAPMFRHSTAEWFRLMYRDETSGSLSVTHYCDGVAAVEGANEQHLPASVDLTKGPIYTTDVTLGPCLRHSFRLSTTAPLVKLTGMGIWSEEHDTVQKGLNEQ